MPNRELSEDAETAEKRSHTETRRHGDETDEGVAC